MENIEETKSVTLSFKATPAERTAIQQIANEKNISKSELMASLISGYKHHYDYIGKASPREAELQVQLENADRYIRKLTTALENAENKIDIERKANQKLIKEQFEFNKKIFNLQEDLKTARLEIGRLQELTVKMETNDAGKNQDPIHLYGSLISAVLTGIALVVSPVVFRK